MATLQRRAKDNPQARDSEADELVVQLLHWFKHEFFKWVDTLPCQRCGPHPYPYPACCCLLLLAAC